MAARWRPHGCTDDGKTVLLVLPWFSNIINELHGYPSFLILDTDNIMNIDCFR